MITAFKPGSHTAEMLIAAREAKGDTFADMLMATVNSKLQVHQMLADGTDEATIDALAEEGAIKLKDYLDANQEDAQFMMMCAEIMVQVATLEDGKEGTFKETSEAGQ